MKPFEPLVFFKKIFFIPDDIVLLDTAAELKAFLHFFLPKLRADFPEVLIGFFILVVFEEKCDSLFVVLDIGIQLSKLDSIFDFILDISDDLLGYLDPLFLRCINNLQAFFDLLRVHRAFRDLQRSLM